MESNPEERRTARTNLFRSFRKLVDPESHGIPKGRRKNVCSQSDMAHLLKISTQTYQAYENCDRDPPDEILLEFAKICGLNKVQEDALWIAVWRQPLPPRYAPMAGMQVSDDYRELVRDDHTNMAYVTDAAWNVLACNDLWASLFSNGIPQNVMRWMVLSDEARGSKKVRNPVLTDWDVEWAPYVLARLSSTYNALGDRVKPLSQLVRDVRNDERAGPIFANAHHLPTRVDGDRSLLRQPIHPDGDQRPLCHPVWGQGYVRLCSMEPQGSPLACYMVLKFSKTRRANRTFLTADGPIPRV